MKTPFLILVVSVFSIISISFASDTDRFIGNDGCYQLYRPGSLYPTLCISGSAEEGINGAGVRIVAVGPNSDQVSFCRKTSSSGIVEFVSGVNRSIFSFDSSSTVQTIEFNGKVDESRREKGVVTITEQGEAVTLDYMKLEIVGARKSWGAFKSEMCRQNGID